MAGEDRVALCVSRFYEELADKLESGAREALALGGAYVGPKVDPGLAATSAATANPGLLNPPPGADPPQTPASGTSTTPKLTLGQGYGDGNTGFQVHGSGFVPGTRVVLSISGVGSTPLTDEPVA